MKENLIQKIFTGFGWASNSRVPLRSNVFGRNGRGSYNPIGTTGSRLFNNDRQSPLLGNAQPSKKISGWYERISEIKQYELLDISKMAVSVFRDYVNNFLNTSTTQMVTIQDEDGNNDEAKTNRINEVLSNDIKLFDYIRDHLDESIYYGSYYSMLQTGRDEKGHTKFHIYGLYDPISVIIKRKLEDGVMIEEFIARGEDGSIYTIPSTECFYLGSPNLRLENDLKDDFQDITRDNKPKFGKQENREKVLKREYYTSGEPLFYSTILKVKELVVKELLISLLSLRDLVSPSLYGISIDKGVPLESAEELCSKIQKMSTSYQELSSFLTAQFDVTSLIETTLSQNIRFFPDYNSTLQNKGVLGTDKLTDKLIEIMQTLDQSRQNVLNPLGIPLTMVDGTSGSKWQVLQQSERLNSRVNSIITGLKESITDLVRTIYKVIYNEELDPSLIKLHIFEKNTVEFNNQLNTAEAISNLVTSITNILTTSLQALDVASPLIDADKYLEYLQNLIKNIDPDASEIISTETIESYKELLKLKSQLAMEQLGGGNQE